MDARMNVYIRVISGTAQKRIRALEAEVAMLRKQVAEANASMATMGARGISPLTKWGNQVQWAGRQLQYNFTLPIAIAGIAATKFALDNEKAMVRVAKVYGDGSDAMREIAKTEIPALEKAFVSLSNYFGIAQSDAINIAADWAAAGASGIALAKSVKLTMETMILGEMEAAEATQALIAIQAQYGEDIKGLIKTIDVLNMVENQTGISMAGLVQGFARSAGTARTMGVDVEHLAAMLAALVPATGNAAAAGNGLKTILSRIMSPTKEADEVMQKMGIHTSDLAWQSLNATQRLEEMAKKFVKLDDAQKIVVATTAASRWQINRFGQIMTDINNPLGYYHRSLNATADSTKNFNQRVFELNQVLDSNPQKLKQLWVILQNALAKVIQPMIPVIVMLAGVLSDLLTKFANLDPAIQKLALAALFLLAVIGPLVRYLGSFATLFGLIHEASRFMTKGLKGAGKALKKDIGEGFTAVKKGAKGIPAALKGIPAHFGKLGVAAGAAMSQGFTAAMILIKKPFAWVLVQMRALWIVFATQMSIIWATLMSNLAGVMAAMGKSLSFIWMALWTRLLTIGAFFKEAQIAIWAEMHVAMTAISVAFAGGLKQIWVAITTMMFLNFGWIKKGWIALVASMKAISFAGIFTSLKAGLYALPALIGKVGKLFSKGALGILTTLFKLVPRIIGLMTGWVGLAALALFGIVYTFRDQIAELFTQLKTKLADTSSGIGKAWAWIAGIFEKGVAFIVEMFWKLPAGVRDAMLAVFEIVYKVALKVYEAFSYLNPFAKHSPSLVEQVKAGMAIIRDEYASVGNVGAVFKKAAKDLAAYKRVINGMTGGPFAEERANVAQYFASALPLFDALLADLKALNAILAVQEAAVSAQQAIVDRWAASLDAANAALDAEEKKLDGLQATLDSLNDAYAAHQQAIEDYASTPLEGMGAMEDAIFANEMAQKSLRLEMMKWEEANGSIEDMQNQMAMLAGSIEQMQGEVKDLTAAGAGSDITGPMQAQIEAMQAAYDDIQKTAEDSPIAEMQAELDRLGREGEMLELEKSLQFDELQRQIEKLVNTTKELTFDEIVAGIEKEQAAMAALQPQIDAATKAVQDQQAAVDAAKASRDAIQATYDAEVAKLDQLKDAYSRTEEAVRSIESALNDMGQAAASASQAASSVGASGFQSPGAVNFDNAAGGNFPEVGDTNSIGRLGGMEDQSALIDEFTKGMTDDLAAKFKQFDMFGPIKEKWNSFTTWMQDNVWSNIGGVVESIKTMFTELGSWFQSTSIGQAFSDAWSGIGDTLSTIWEWGSKIWNLFKDDLKHIFDVIADAGKRIWTEIGPELEKFKELIPGLTKIFGWLWNVIKIVAAVVGVLLVGAFKIISSVIAHVFKPVLDTIIDIVKNIIRVFRGVIEFFVGIFTGDLDQALQGIKDIFGGLWDGIFAIFKGAWDIIWGIVEGIVNGIIDFFKFLWDELVGHSIIPDMINAIIEWFKGLPGAIWDALKSLGDKIMEIVQGAWDWWVDANEKAWTTIVNWFKELPGKAWDALIAIKDKIGQVATDAWNWFIDRQKRGWAKIATWLGERAQAVWDKIIAIKDKIGEVARTAWDWFKTKSSEGWDKISKWLGTLPQATWDKIIAIKDKLTEVARAGFQALVDKAKDIIDGKNGFMTWITGIPGRIGKLLGTIGSTVANAIKAAWNGVANWINNNGIAAVNKVTTHFGFTLGKLPTFEGGGVIPGRVSRKDNTIIAARSGEGVIVPELVRILGGASGLAQLNNAAKQGSGAVAQLGVERFANGGVIGAAKAAGIKGYEGGGVIDSVTGWLKKGVGFALSEIIGAFKKPIKALIPGEPFAEKWTVGYLNDWQAKAKEWGDQQEQMGNGVVSPIGYKTMEAILTNRFGHNIDFYSDYRSASANRQAGGSATSLHMRGRAVDMTPRKDIFDFIHNTYGKNTTQLFWTPQNGRNIMGGQEVTIGGALAADHYDHIHWGYDKGGILPPGLTLAQNSTGKNEYTFTNADWQTLSNVVSLMDSITQKRNVAGAPEGMAVARMGSTLTRLEGRLRTQNASSTATTRAPSGDTIYNFYGDLEFPNVKNGEDAEDFLKHLKGLGG
jgi:TP901 family phage tail tape measure protein